MRRDMLEAAHLVILRQQVMFAWRVLSSTEVAIPVWKDVDARLMLSILLNLVVDASTKTALKHPGCWVLPSVARYGIQHLARVRNEPPDVTIARMDVPPIARQVRRPAGSGAEAAAFGSVVWLSRAGDPPGAEMTVGIATFDAAKGNAEHIHPNCEEVVYVLEGAVMHTLGDQQTVLHAGDLIVVPRDVPHRLFNDGTAPARAYIVFSSPDREFVPTGR